MKDYVLNRWKVGIVGAVLFAGVYLIAAAEEIRDEGNQIARVILLNNGRILRGQPTYLGDHCVLQLSSGGTVRLPAREVAADCADLLEAYQHLQHTVAQNSSVEPRLGLVRWCLREGLLEQASDTLLDLMQLAPEHPGIEPLLKQIHIQRQQAARVASPKPEATTPPVASPSSRPVANDELELLAQSLPKPALAMFSATVQPLLINRCGGSGCHTGNRAGALRLLQPARGAGFFRRMSLRNLHTVLQHVDWENPDNSPLLTIPRKPHGPAKAALIGNENEELYRTLHEWIRQATQTIQPAGGEAALAEAVAREGVPLNLDQQAQPGASFPPVRPSLPGSARQSALARPGGPATETSPQDGSPADGLSAARHRAVSRAVENREQAPPSLPPNPAMPPGSLPSGDPFDPAIFNRRFHGRP